VGDPKKVELVVTRPDVAGDGCSTGKRRGESHEIITGWIFLLQWTTTRLRLR